MTTIDATRVIFFQVSDATSKVARLAQTAHEHFSLKEHFLIIAEDDRALAYADELLWNHTPEFFLPHSIVDSETEEWVALTKIKKNLNHARFVFNLCSTPLILEGSFRIIYDYDDGTSPSRKNLCASRFDAYKQAQYAIESRNSIDS
jgi:DNA polymerase IIIc chi subunit